MDRNDMPDIPFYGFEQGRQSTDDPLTCENLPHEEDWWQGDERLFTERT